jgi:hypothetical protein
VTRSQQSIGMEAMKTTKWINYSVNSFSPQLYSLSPQLYSLSPQLYSLSPQLYSRSTLIFRGRQSK